MSDNIVAEPVQVAKAKTEKNVSKEEVNATLDKIFNNVDEAIKENSDRKFTLEDVDRTLQALFDTVNKVHTEGKNVKLPDFKKIIKRS